MDFATVMVLALACGLIGVFIDNFRGAILGLLLGQLGLLISAILAVGVKR